MLRKKSHRETAIVSKSYSDHHHLDIVRNMNIKVLLEKMQMEMRNMLLDTKRKNKPCYKVAENFTEL